MIKPTDIRLVLRNTGEVLEWFSLVFLIPLAYTIVVGDIKGIAAFAIPMATSLLVGVLLKKAFYSKYPSQTVHAMVAVVIVWLLACILAGAPFVMGLGKPWLDAVFQSTSALTTTGLDIFHGSALNMSTIPPIYVFWTNFLSWIGGAGIVMIALVGLISIFESSKFALAEGREERIKPNIVHTARLIWEIYIILTVFGIILLLLSGMNLFDATNYAMSAISTTGFGTSDGVVITNPLTQIALMIIMFIGATSFFAHYMVYKKDKLFYFKDTQIFTMLSLIVIGFFLIVGVMIPIYGQSGFRSALFSVVSAITCGGFAPIKMTKLLATSQPALIILAALMVIGGSAGSTSGGIKLSRFIVFMKTLYWKIKRLLLPRSAVFVRKFEGKMLSHEEVENILFFILMYVVFIFIGTLVLALTGYSFMESFFEVVSAQSNSGLTLITSAGMPWIAKLMLITNMIVGRLEIIPFLILIGFVLEIGSRRL